MAGRPRNHSESSCSSHGSEHEKLTPSNDVVLNKYINAGKIAEQVLTELLPKIVEGASVAKLCADGDKLIIELTNNFNKKDKKLKKGIALPVCISVNNVICHYAPLVSDPDTVLAEGNMVKIDLAVHIDGFIGSVAHTVVVGATKEKKVTGAKADVMLAAYNAMEATVRMLHAGKFKSTEISTTVDDIALTFKVKPVENMLCHEVEQNLLDGEKYIVMNPSDEQKSKIEVHDFEKYEVYAVDIFMSSGDGKAKQQASRTTIYRRLDEAVYNLKMKASRTFFSDVAQKHGTLLFNLRDCEDENKAKIAVSECERHGLLKAFPVFADVDASYVAQYKCTVIIQPSGLLKTCHIPIDHDVLDSKHVIEKPEIKSILNSALKPKKKTAKKAADATIKSSSEC